MKEISEIDVEALVLEQGNKNTRRENTVEALVEAVTCEDDKGTNKAIHEMYVGSMML